MFEKVLKSLIDLVDYFGMSTFIIGRHILLNFGLTPYLVLSRYANASMSYSQSGIVP